MQQNSDLNNEAMPQNTESEPLKVAQRESIAQVSGVDNVDNHKTSEPPQEVEEFALAKWWKDLRSSAVIQAFAGLLIAGLATVFVLMFFVKKDKEKEVVININTAPKAETAQNAKPYSPFTLAPEEEIGAVVESLVKPYQITAGLENVVNKEAADLSESAKEKLARQAFVVLPSDFPDFSSLHQNNQAVNLPNFLTTDSILHEYHLYLNWLVKNLEQEQLFSLWRGLTDEMMAHSLSFYELLQGTAWENAAKRNAAYFSVAQKIIDPGKEAPEFIKTAVEKELKYINEHNVEEFSPVMNLGVANPNPDASFKENYTNYIAPASYNASDDLAAFYKLQQWYTRLSFRTSSEDETKSALLISLALWQNDASKKKWQALHDVLGFLAGQEEGISYDHYQSILAQVYGASVKVQDSEKFALAWEEIKNLEVFPKALAPDSGSEAGSFRFLPRKIRPEKALFDSLVCPNVGNKDKSVKCDKEHGSRLTALALDLPAALGSGEANNLLRALGHADYANYPEKLSEISGQAGSFEKQDWLGDRYWYWLYVGQFLLNDKSANYPSFMNNFRWARKDLNTFLGSWTASRDEGSVEAAESGRLAAEDLRLGCVEPNPHVYARLANLMKTVKQGLEYYEILSEEQGSYLDQLIEKAMKLKVIAEKELRAEALSEEDYAFINNYDFSLHSIEQAGERLEEKNIVLKGAMPFYTPLSGLGQEMMMEGVDKVFEIYVVVPVGEELVLTRGGVYSYFEEPWSPERSDVPSYRPEYLPPWSDEYLAEE